MQLELEAPSPPLVAHVLLVYLIPLTPHRPLEVGVKIIAAHCGTEVGVYGA